ncbi:MAG: radical SAM protein [Candidatus Aenigmatarchaeota archaeon]
MKVLLVRPPKFIWTMFEEFENFMMPQNLLCLASILKENNIKVEVIDCCIEKIGWKSLRKIIEKKKPDVIGAGSETCYSHEDGKLFKMAKEINPKTVTVAGGIHHSSMFEDSLSKYPIDFIVRGEGEYTLLELVKELQKPRKKFRKIKGIAYKGKNEKIIRTKPRPLIENLDDLPFPAYELMPMHRYTENSFVLNPMVTLHHSRGCIGHCKFCICWPQMAEERITKGRLCRYSRWRTKSVDRTIREIENLYHKYKVRVFFFTDDAWNVNPEWSREFSEKLIEKNLDIVWFSNGMRAEDIVRDEKLGIFKKMVESGLRQVLIGVERATTEELEDMNAKHKNVDIVKECARIMNERYPEVMKQGTFIVGIADETRESMLRQLRYALELKMDISPFQFYTPLPGSDLWKKAKKDGLIENYDFRKYDFTSEPIIRTKYLTKKEMIELRNYVTIKFYFYQFLRYMKKMPFMDIDNVKLLGFKYFIRSRSPLALMMRLFFDPFISRAVAPGLFNEEGVAKRKPSWYDK